MKLKLLLIVALVVVGSGAVYYSMGGLTANAASQTRYLTSAAALGDVSDQVAATGTVSPTAAYGVAFGAAAHVIGASTTSSASSGGSGATFPVATVKVQVGDTVKKGQLLASASGKDLAAALTSARNSWTIAKLQLTAAQDALTTADSGGVSANIRQARISVYNAENQEAQAHTAYVDAIAQRKQVHLFAPIDGVVTAVNIQRRRRRPVGRRDHLAAGDLRGHRGCRRERHQLGSRSARPPRRRSARSAPT